MQDFIKAFLALFSIFHTPVGESRAKFIKEAIERATKRRAAREARKPKE